MVIVELEVRFSSNERVQLSFWPLGVGVGVRDLSSSDPSGETASIPGLEPASVRGRLLYGLTEPEALGHCF